MATSFGGFIASALGGAAKGYGEGAQMEMKKQSELDLKKQLMDAETERNLRVDDIKRQRDVSYARAEVANAQNPETIAAAAKAKADLYDALIANKVPAAEARLLVAQGIATADTREKLAPVNAAADVIVGKAAADTKGKLADVNAAADVTVGKAEAGAKTQLIPTNQALAIAIAKSEAEIKTANAPGAANADAAAVLAKAEAEAKLAPDLVQALKKQYDATKEFVKQKATDLTAAKAAELKELVGDTVYMEALKKQNAALHQHLLDVANINAAKDIKVAETRAASSDERTAAQLKAAELKAEEARLKRLAEANKPSKGPGGGAEGSIALERAEKSAKEALARALGVEAKEANGAYIALKRRADGGDTAAKAKLAEVTPMKDRLEAASAEWEARKKAPAAAAPAAAASSFTPAMPPGFKGAAPPPPSRFKLD